MMDLMDIMHELNKWEVAGHPNGSTISHLNCSTARGGTGRLEHKPDLT